MDIVIMSKTVVPTTKSQPNCWVEAAGPVVSTPDPEAGRLVPVIATSPEMIDAYPNQPVELTMMTLLMFSIPFNKTSLTSTIQEQQ
ncbi:hypothetical protein ACT691_17550 [Vibrio metschnikovii]